MVAPVAAASSAFRVLNINLSTSLQGNLRGTILAINPDTFGNTLYWRTGSALRCEDGQSRMEDGEAAVLVASEPLFEAERWQKVPMNSIIAVDADRSVDIRPL